jgi:hypothetical protein
MFQSSLNKYAGSYASKTAISKFEIVLMLELLNLEIEDEKINKIDGSSMHTHTHTHTHTHIYIYIYICTCKEKRVFMENSITSELQES